jgi:N-acetylmuramoyl-L-alanine amidase
MIPTVFNRSLIALLFAASACAPLRRVAVVPARPAAPVNPSLPPMPLVQGPLAINVVYPRRGETVASTDSAFIFGSLGNGNAFLTINGIPAPVWPNGAFMAFLPVPTNSPPTYELVASVGRRSARLSHPVQLPAAPPPAPPPPAAPLPVTTDTSAPGNERAPGPAAPRYALIGTGPSAISDTDRVIWGPASPDPGLRAPASRFFLLPATLVRVRDTVGSSVRVALDEGQEILVPAREVAVQPEGFVPPRRVAGALRVEPSAEWVDVIIPTGSVPPYLATEDSSARTITLTLYDTPSATAADTMSGRFDAYADPLLAAIERTHTATRSSYTFRLKRRVFGYQAAWRDSSFVLRIRRSPTVDVAAPLRGLTITVDPGHPGAPGESPGATGPTGLLEMDAALAVSLRLRDLLQQRGANVVMTRTTNDPVPLNERPVIARRANAHALVSVHLNAVPDHVNPFISHGSSTYYWHMHSRPLAEYTQQALLRHMFLRDLGVRRDNFALVRPAWMPAVLAEGAFIMMPDQEHALRTAQYQDAYARALLEGLERYFAEIAVGW